MYLLWWGDCLVITTSSKVVIHGNDIINQGPKASIDISNTFKNWWVFWFYYTIVNYDCAKLDSERWDRVVGICCIGCLHKKRDTSYTTSVA